MAEDDESLAESTNHIDSLLLANDTVISSLSLDAAPQQAGFSSAFSFLLSPSPVRIQQDDSSSHHQSVIVAQAPDPPPLDPTELQPHSFSFVSSPQITSDIRPTYLSSLVSEKPSLDVCSKPSITTTTVTGGLGHLLSSKKRKTRRANPPGYNNITSQHNYNDRGSETASVKSSRPTGSEPDVSNTQVNAPADGVFPPIESRPSSLNDSWQLETLTNIHESGTHSPTKLIARKSVMHYDLNDSHVNDERDGYQPTVSVNPLVSNGGGQGTGALNIEQYPIYPKPPPPPPSNDGKNRPSENGLESVEPIKPPTAWDVTDHLIKHFYNLSEEEELIVKAETTARSEYFKVRDSIRELSLKVEALRKLQDQKIEEEDYTQAEVLDDELKKLKTKVVSDCMNRFVISRRAVLDEAADRASFETRRSAVDIERFKFESERLHLELTQIMKQFSSIDSELTQVEHKIKAITSADETEKQDALDKKIKVDAEVEELQKLLNSKLKEQYDLQQIVGACDIRMAAARSKFKKQLARLETSRASLNTARQEVISERRQVLSMKSSMWSDRQEAEERIDRLLREVSGICVAREELKRRIKIPLKVLVDLRKWIVDKIEKMSEEVSNAEEGLKRIVDEVEKYQQDIESINQSVVQLRSEKSAIRQHVASLNSQKIAAIAARAFREAGKLTNQIKELEEKDKSTDGEVSELSITAANLRRELTEKEEEEERLRHCLEEENKVRAVMMVKILCKYQKHLRLHLEEFQKYFAMMEQCRNEENEELDSLLASPLSSWSNITIRLLNCLKSEKNMVNSNRNGNDDHSDECKSNGNHSIENDAQDTGRDNKEKLDSVAKYHPIVNQLRDVSTTFEARLLSQTKAELDGCEDLKSHWIKNFDLHDNSISQSDNDVENEKEEIEITISLQDRDVSEECDEFDIEENFKGCQKFLDETRELLYPVMVMKEENSDLDVFLSTTEDNMNSTCEIQSDGIDINPCLKKSIDGLLTNDNQQDLADSSRQKKSETTLDKPETKFDESYNADIDHVDACNSSHLMQENCDSSFVEVSSSSVASFPFLESSVFIYSGIEDELSVPEIESKITELETELERAVSGEKFNLAAVLDEQIKILRSKLA